MDCNNETLAAYPFSTVREHLFVTVPWEVAEELRALLLSHDIPSTACFDPETHTAGLEILNGADPDRVREILAGWEEGQAMV